MSQKIAFFGFFGALAFAAILVIAGQALKINEVSAVGMAITVITLALGLIVSLIPQTDPFSRTDAKSNWWMTWNNYRVKWQPRGGFTLFFVSSILLFQALALQHFAGKNFLYYLFAISGILIWVAANLVLAA